MIDLWPSLPMASMDSVDGVCLVVHRFEYKDHLLGSDPFGCDLMEVEVGALSLVIAWRMAVEQRTQSRIVFYR